MNSTFAKKNGAMRYLSNEAIRSEILDGMQSQGIDETELAEMLGISTEKVHTFLSEGYDFSVCEIREILLALDLSMRIDVVPF